MVRVRYIRWIFPLSVMTTRHLRVRVDRRISSRNDNDDIQVTRQLIDDLCEFTDMDLTKRFSETETEVEHPHPVLPMQSGNGSFDCFMGREAEISARELRVTRPTGDRFKQSSNIDRSHSGYGSMVAQLFLQSR
jgi:hypothetical protein